MELDIHIHDIKDAERVVTSDDFAQLLLSKTTSFAAAAFILQTILDAIKEAKAKLGEDD